MYISVPTLDTTTGLWSDTDFDTRTDFSDFLWTLWKEPGQYAFDENVKYFNEQATFFNKNGYFCNAPFRSKDFLFYWDFEKRKCRNGIIIKSPTKTWYIGRDYYMWLNFLPIYNKETKLFSFADIRDAQYHMALYEDIAEQTYKHVAILKKRQIASSYFHAAKLYNRFAFEEGAVLKMAASLKDYINEKGTWRFLEEYRNFCNEHTGWYRPCTPDKVLNWTQKVEVTTGGKKTDKGLKSTIMGLVLEKDPSNGVGGPCSIFFHEEAGIAPKMGTTLEFLKPSLKSGMIYTGMFCVAGSVGELDQCEPLKQLIYNPASQDVLAVETDLLDEHGKKGMCGLFIPEQWSMQPCIDKYGNSQVEDALAEIMKERAQWKKDVAPDLYQLRISQKPTNIAEAFAFRKASKFSPALLTAQSRRIEDNKYPVKYIKLDRDENGNVYAQGSTRRPIREFPISPKTTDKEGVIEVFEEPMADAAWGTYYASVDPVDTGKTTTSESLCSIYVLKNSVQVTRHKLDGTTETEIQPSKIVACWTGRFDDLTKTHERLLLIIQYYNAWTVVENNISKFIQYMIEKRQQKFLVPKNQIAFLKELQANNNVYQDYGWKNTGTMFKVNMIPYMQHYVSEEIDVEFMPDGTIVRTVHGIERIPDIMAIIEMREYQDGVNVDRLVALTALITFAAVQEANKGYIKKTTYENTGNVKMPENNRILSKSPFRNIGTSSPTAGSSTRPIQRSGFRNLGRRR